MRRFCEFIATKVEPIHYLHIILATIHLSIFSAFH